MTTRSITFDAAAGISISLVGVASGAGRISTALTNTNNRPAALISLDLELNAGVLATVGATIEVYLLRTGGSTVRDDNAGAVDAAYTPKNAPLLGTLIVPSGVAFGDNIAATFDTAVLGPLGPNWSLGIFNRTGQALGAEANMTKSVEYYTDTAA